MKSLLAWTLLLGLGAPLTLAAAPVTDAAMGDLTPIAAADWTPEKARHLLARAGFGGTPEEIAALAALTPQAAVRRLVYFEGVPPPTLAPFAESGILDPGIDPFPPSRPATTALAEKTGSALGIKVKAAGNRPEQAVVNEFFYWLRASRLETERVAYWWGNRMVATNRPLEEKMALFWHGHFATSEEKVRDYRKLLQQITLFQRAGLGNFRALVINVAQGPAMLAFLDAGVNIKGSPNENFAREIMELFTMGVGHYTETDIREAARAFTGWNFVGLEFHVDPAQHDDNAKTFLGQTANYDGVGIIDRILAAPSTPGYIAGKLYRFFVRPDLSPELQATLATRLRDNNYELAPFLEAIFLSKDFYAKASTATRIKSPVEFVVSTYRQLGQRHLPGVPDFNRVTEALGQHLLFPPTVAGWSYGRSWITPSLLIERGNFALDLAFPDISFIPADRYPEYPTGEEIRTVHRRLRAGEDIVSATRPLDGDAGGEMIAMSNRQDHAEAFNTRYASYRGWQMAIERVTPITRDLAKLDLTQLVVHQQLTTPLAVVDYFAARLLSVPLPAATRQQLADTFERELGSPDVRAYSSVMEEPLRLLLHLLLSRPEYQLG
ncbi:MAG: DUF1800 domain-containing protein [Gammaproteobacteria bacterium]|nr:DUF1800 domain-containing protein [Gammaproteobacteria bacterium]